MKQVLKISVKGKFHQYLKFSEVRFINDMVKHGKIEVELTKLDNHTYNLHFGTCHKIEWPTTEEINQDTAMYAAHLARF